MSAAWAQGEGARELADEERAPAPAAPVMTRAPVLAEFVEAPYPEAAKAEKLEAAVPLVLTIDAGGAVTEVVVDGAAVGHGFDEAAVAAARRFRFEPAEIDGKPAPIRIRFTYRFAFQEEVAPAPAETRTGRVVGRVREKGSRIPVPGAPVGVAVAGLEVQADATGRFALPPLEPGTYEVVATSPEHRREKVQITVAADEEVAIDFFLQPLVTSPFEIVVKGERETTSLTRRTVEREQLRSVPGTFGDPLRVVQNLPGVARPPYVLGVLLVRGSSPGDSANMVDGHEIPILYHFAGGPSVLPAQMLERIDFYPGNFSVRYGRAIGGIIDVETRTPDPERWHGSVDIDLFDAGLFVEGPLGDTTSMSAGVRRSYVDAVIELADATTDEDIAVVLPVYYDYQSRVDHRLSKAHRLALLVFGSEDHLTLVGDPGGAGGPNSDVSARVGFHRLKGEWLAKLDDDVEWVLSPVVGLDQTKFEAGELDADADVFEWALRWDVRIALAETLTLRTGIDGLGRQVTLSAQTPLRIPDYRPYPSAGFATRETTKVERSLGLHAVGAYLEAEWRAFGGPVTLIPGVRADYYRFFEENRAFADPRLNVRWALDERWTLKAGAGIFSQAPPEWRLDPEFGNPDLELEWAEHYGLGVEWQLTEAISVDLQGFLNVRHDLAERAEFAEGTGAVEGDEVDLELPRFENIGEGRSYGMELLLRHEVTKAFYGWISYTLSRSEQHNAPDEPYVATTFDQTHNLTLVASYKFGEGWEAGMRFRLTSGNLEQVITRATFDADSGNHRGVADETSTERQPPFNQLDLRIEKTWRYDLFKVSAYLDIQNVYFATNPEFTAYDYRFRESAPVPGLPILPTFGFEGSF